jgi:octaprenyl-diphosphate synthase
MIKEVSEYINGSGGKRLRPILALLSAKAFDYEGEHHILIAAIVELIHTATLLHDDVVDNSNLRRGKQTANVVFGNNASVLVGDFLYSRSFQMMVLINNLQVMKILADASNRIAEGEVMQLMNCNDPSTNESKYMETILRKTATLFEAAAELGAVVSGQNEAVCQSMAKFGLHTGMAFQLVDDALDYGSSDKDIGKTIGDDLAEGKPTLPLIHVLQHGNSDQINLVKQAIENNRADNLTAIRAAIADTKALDYTLAAAERQVAIAIECLVDLPDSHYKAGLIALAQYAVTRQF